MVIEVSPLIHIEVVVRDAEKAAKFLNKVFGAKKVEENIADYLSRFPAVKVVHVQLGNVIIQFIEPLADGTIWADFLKEKGPGVHNLNFSVKNVKKAGRVFKQEGLKTLFKLKLDWNQFNNPEDLRSNIPPVYMLEGSEIVGFRFELQENPFKEEKTPEDQRIKSSYDLKRG